MTLINLCGRYPILSYPILSYPILSYPILSYKFIFKVLLYLSINLFLYNIYSNDNWRLFLKKTLFIKKYFQGVKL